MEKSIVWRTAQGHYSLLLNLSKPEKVRIGLGNAADFQQKGEIPLYLQEDGRREILTTIRLHHLSPKPRGEETAALLCDYNGKKELQIKILSNGREIHSETVPVPGVKRTGKFRPVFLLLLLPLLLVAGTLVFFFEPQAGTKNASGFSSSIPAAQKPAEPLPRPAAGTPSGGTVSPEKLEKTEVSPPPAVDRTPLPSAAESFVLEPLTIYFQPEMSEIMPEARRELERLIEIIHGRELLVLVISGHCALYGSEAAREELSLHRAESAAAFLRDQGIELPKETKITGEGGKRPVTRNWNRQELNRRVEIRIEGKKEG